MVHPQAMNTLAQTHPTAASATAAPVAILAGMMLLVPAPGSPSELGINWTLTLIHLTNSGELMQRFLKIF